MRETIHTKSIKVVIVCIFLYAITPLYADIPWLHVEGNRIKDPNGNVVVLRGISLIDLGFLEGWQGGAINMIDRITDTNDSQGSSPGWYPKVIRIPIHPPDSVNNWPHRWGSDNDRFYNNLLRPVVDYCADKDIYVIIDWHYITDTWDKVSQTSEFWEYMAPRFANDSHVLFELFNEPINRGGSNTNRWLSVRADMQTWVDIVRSYAPNNLILVGGPSWSQIIEPAATYPVSGNNIVYVSHIYPAHWLGIYGNTTWFRNQITTCSAVHPVIMTEWGFTTTSETLLNGTVAKYGQPLMDFIEGLGIGNTAWCASNNWGPPMFHADWTLRCGEGEMGCFVKDTLYEKRNDDIVFPADGDIEPAEIPFKRGVNLTDWLQFFSNVRQIQFTKFTKQDFINIKSLGCDVIRLPIELHSMTNGEPNYTFDPLFYYFLDQIIDWAEELELHLILDNQSFDPATTSTDPNIGDILVPVWTQMAQRYKDRSTYIYYEVLNEPHGISETTWNRIQQEVIDAIRAVDQKHTIIVGPAGWNNFNNLKFMPEYEDDNLIYTFHFYDPFVFTHQGAGWPNPSLVQLAGVPFPYDAARMPDCPPELENTWISSNLADYRNTGTVEHVKELIDIAADFKTTRDAPLFCGEFGVLMLNSNNEDRIYWYNVVRSYLEQKGIAWTMWDYKGGFGLFEQGTDELFDYDLNIPLVEALGLNAPPQQEFILVPDVNEFDIYLDYIAPKIIESNWISKGIIDYYSQDNPASGNYCIHWTGADLWNSISFRFSPVKDLSVLVDEDFAIDFWVRCDSPNARILIRFMDTNTDDPDDHPWRIIYPIDRNVAVWDGRWNHLQIPLNAFYEQGSWDFDNDRWYNPVGAFDWTATEHFEILAEYNDLEGIHFYFDDIRVVEPNPPIDPDKAYNPYPPDGVQFIDPNVTLNWAAGFSEASHFVYFGDNFDDVNVADTSDTTGIYRSVQAATTYTPGPLELEKTYYWRVDEVEATRHTATIHKGDVWSFRTKPFIPITDFSLIGWWKLDEGSGAIAVDWSGHDNDGILVGDPQWVAGKIGRALKFDGNDDYVDCGYDPNFNITDEVTVAAWIKLSATGIDQKVGSNQSGIAGGYKMTVFSDNKVEFEIRTSGNTPILNRDVGGGTVLHQDVWYHVAGVYSQKGNYIRTYVNGVLDREMSTTEVLGASPGSFKIACEPFEIGPYNFNGVMDDVRIYNIALSDAEIHALGALSEASTIPN